MGAIEVDTAKALAAALTAYPFYVSGVTGATGVTGITAVFEYVPDHESTDLTTLRVSCVPDTLEVTQVSRGSDLHEFPVHIVMAKRLLSDTEIEVMTELRSQVADKVRSFVLPTTGAAAMPTGVQYKSLAVEATFNRDSLTNQRTFLADVAVTYVANLRKDAS